ncbi:pyruvate/2-oxoglutarate dehydrogenase complex dihydrolipoamide dehydrogenase (E3) component [Rhodoligotrophos appendicifer]|uniref:dihydrolipoyl dehydrogenase family protein n=1 Tax=Rhodoligotrophos appendicifer TaxID=987056 RepID=UPI001186D203|nr:FAD-dependent oxidoreductase [Rhodoligotrophos appendicifer]
MTSDRQCDVCVIGAGSGGLSVAAGAAQLGLKTVLIEPGLMGGDCLNTGCVPSKALLALAKRAHLDSDRPAFTRHQIRDYIRETIDQIAPHDSQERLEGLGVHVVRQHATFESATRLLAGETAITARYFVVAAGSHAAVPPIPGLDPRRILTNETIFSIAETPDHLVVIGGGPIGIEMAQAHRRLGSKVTVLEIHRILPKDEPELVEIVRRTLEAQGVEILENVKVEAVEYLDTGTRVWIEHAGTRRSLEGSHLLISVGRKVNVDGLGLDAAGIAFDGKGIKTDARLRTSQKHIFAIGDIAGGPQFTHVAGYHAGIVIRNIAFRLPAKVDYSALPWVTYTDPELAHVGLTLTEARERFGKDVRGPVHSFKSVDRAVAERREEGLLKLVARSNGRILGCSIVAPGAGEMIGVWGLAIQQKLKLKDVASLILPYPTFSEISKQAASEWYKPTLFGDRTRWLVRLLQKLPQL